MLRRTTTLITCLLASSGCVPGVGIGIPRDRPPAVAADPGPPTSVRTTPPGEAAARSFAETVVASLNAGDGGPFDAALDHEMLLSRAARGIDLPATFRSGILAGMQREPMGAHLASSAEQGMAPSLLSVSEDGATALLRILGTAGVNYLELSLFEGADGSVRIQDLQPAVAGEWLSETLRRRIASGLAATADRSLAEKLLRHAPAEIEALPRMAEMGQQIVAGDNEGALATYASLPESLQADKSASLLALTAASYVDDATHQAAFERHRTQFPDDPAIDLLSIDYHFARGETELAIAAVDRTEARYGDPYLSFLRGTILHAAGRTEEAEANVLAALALEPSLEDAWWTLVSFSLERDDHVQTAMLLVELEDRGVEIADLTTIEGFERFTASPEHARWLRSSIVGR